VGVTYLSLTKCELAGSHRLMRRSDTCLGKHTHLSICGIMEHLIFYINVCIVVFVFRFMEIGLEGCLDMLMLCVCCLFICTLKRTLPVPDILSISIQIPYYTNVRKLCRYYNMFESISFDIYNVESMLLSSYVAWRNDILILTMLHYVCILLESFVTPAGISMGIKLRTEFFPIL